jgi:hypothetical protein
MRFDTQPAKFYGGLDWHAWSMDGCILNQDGDIVVHRHMRAKPDALLQIVAPSREDLVVAVEWTLHLGPGWPTRCPGGAALRPGPRALHEGHPWGSGQARYN